MSDILKLIEKLKFIRDYECRTRDEINAMNDAITELSAQPERKTGRWIIRDNPGTGWYRITCSECGEDVTATAPCIGFFPNAKVNWDYCPSCGAKMEGTP